MSHKISMPKSPLFIFAGLAGLLMIGVAIGIRSESYSTFLLGSNAKDLHWGPMLFRFMLGFHGAVLVGLAFLNKANEAPVHGSGGTTTPRPERLTPKVVGILVLLSVVALALRLWHLDSGMWIDEVFTVIDFVRKPMGEIVTSFPSQNQHMLFSILARLSADVFGESVWSVRLPSVLFGIGSIWAFFLLCRRLLGTQEALLGAALLTVSYHHIWFSQNARGYMGLLFFTLLATWFWFEALRSNGWRWWVGYTAAIVLGMWIHQTMAFVVASHAIIHLLLLARPALAGTRTKSFSPERRAGMRPFVAWILSVTLTLQVYALALPEFLAVGIHEESRDSEWTNPLWVLTESVKGLSIGFAGIAIVLIGAGLVAFGWVSLFRKDRRAAVLMVLPPLLAGGTMLALGHNIWPRFFFFAMGFGLLIVIYGAVELPKFVSGLFPRVGISTAIGAYGGVAFCLLLIAASVMTVPKNYALPKQNFAGAKSYIESNVLPGDKIVAVRLAGVVYGNYLTPHWPVAKTGAELESLQQGSDRVWLVYTLPIEVKAFRPEMWKLIEDDYDVVKVFPGTLNGGEVFVCQKKAGA